MQKILNIFYFKNNIESSTSESEESEDENRIKDSFLDKNSFSADLNSLKPNLNRNSTLLKNKTDKGKKNSFDSQDEKYILNNESFDRVSKDHHSKTNGASSFKSTEVMKLKNTKINQGVLQGLNIFHHKHQNGFIDVYWLHDDGGKT